MVELRPYTSPPKPYKPAVVVQQQNSSQYFIRQAESYSGILTPDGKTIEYADNQWFLNGQHYRPKISPFDQFNMPKPADYKETKWTRFEFRHPNRALALEVTGTIAAGVLRGALCLTTLGVSEWCYKELTHPRLDLHHDPDNRDYFQLLLI